MTRAALCVLLLMLGACAGMPPPTGPVSPDCPRPVVVVCIFASCHEVMHPGPPN